MQLLRYLFAITSRRAGSVLPAFAIFLLTQHGAVPLDWDPNSARPMRTASRPSLPLIFEPHGSAFIARGAGYDLQLQAGEARLFLRQAQGSTPPGGTQLRITPKDANPSPKLLGEGPLPGKTNYYMGKDRAAWVTGVPHFARVRCREVYQGIDLVYYGNQGRVEFDFVVAPGADPSRIELVFDGASGMRIDDKGDLLLETSDGTVRQRRPVAYQQLDGDRILVDADYTLREGSTVGFDLEPYDSTQLLVIDPILDYSTYVGGNQTDEIEGVALDASGNIYVSGFTESTSFPPGGLLSGSRQGEDAFVMKLDPSGTQVLYLSYLAGSDDEDGFNWVAATADGTAVVAGVTESLDFPLLNPLQQSFGGGVEDMFIVQLDEEGELAFSTYFGGSGDDEVYDLALDGTGNIYVTGFTDSADYPVKAALQSQYGGGPGDGFITKLGTNGSEVVYSTYLGGTGEEWVNALDVDASGAAYAAGFVDSLDFPVTEGAHREMPAGDADAFMTKLNPAGSALVYSTRLGGSNFDAAIAVAIDQEGNAYVAGNTESDDFPVMSIQDTRAGDEDTFITKLNVEGSQLVYSTYLGGSLRDRVNNMQVNSYGEAYVIGWTQSADFPLRDSFQEEFRGEDDGFVYKVNAEGEALVYSTYLGGSAFDIPIEIALDRVGGLIAVGGFTRSTNFPTTTPVQPTNAGNGDAFVSILMEAVGASAASYARRDLAPDSIASVFGLNFSDETQAASAGSSLPMSLLDVSVTITDSQGVERACGLFLVLPLQINFHVHPDTALGPATLTVNTADGRKLRGEVNIVAVGPGLFSANASGQGVAAANVLRIRDGQGTFEPAARFEDATGVFVPEPIDMGPETDQIYLVIYGTGMRAAGGATVTVGGAEVGVAGPVPQGQFVGLDQMNLGPLPRTLIGQGEVEIAAEVGGKMVNRVMAVFE